MIDQNPKGSKLAQFFREYRQEIKFFGIFTTILVVTYLLLNTDAVADRVSRPLTVGETFIAAKILNVVGFPNDQRELYISGTQGNPFRMQVLNTCNGLFESVIFLAAFFAIQIPWRRKLGWMAGGFIFFHIINELRLVSLFIIGSKFSADTFVFFHETFWNFAIVIVALCTFIFCAYHASKSTLPRPGTEAA